jgi:cell surface protein SprA
MEYRQYEAKNAVKTYWGDRRKGDKSEVRQSFIPKLNVGGEAFDKIFGSNVINIVPQGSAELIFGISTSKINNPNISERLRKTTTFDFQEKIQMNVTGNIGDKMKLGINYNTEATFDFENKTKLEYTGKEDEIIKKIEAGNVSLPLSGSLITGSQSLFGLKTELQFGKLTVTTVLSQQKGESSVIEVKGGAQINQFEIPIDQYDANKHFFLSHFFRDRYEEALKTLPIVNSGFTITKIEVWITNKSSTFDNSRNIVAFLDLAESKKYQYNTVSSFDYRSGVYPENKINSLYDEVINTYHARDIKQVSNSLAALSGQNFRIGQDFEKIENARKLTEREFTFHPTLGYISLNSALNADEILAVAYEYTFQGKTYKVGELSTSGISSPNALVVKLLKGTSFTPKLPNWDLMMKNVYSINAYQVNRDNFQLHVLYQDDKKGTAVNYIPETETSNDILLQQLGLDNVNTNLDPHPDGVFDFIEGVTVNSSNGRIYFPTLEPFGSTMRTYLAKRGLSTAVSQKYIFTELYDSTQTKARQVAEKNKYKLKGTYQSSSTSDIALNALNVPQGSVVVTASGRKLTENIDYTVDYTLGRVKIINQGLLESGTPIKISLESNSLFNFQTKTMVGTHLDYKFSDNFHLGATILNLTERPLTQKVNIGDEPVSNTIWGINGTYTTKSQLLTTLIDKLPLIQTKEPSSITIDGEFAQLIPGSSSAINGTAYIDDFEGSETSIDMRSYQSWTLASTPLDPVLFPESSLNNDLKYGYNRAKLAWYVIDPLFLRSNSATPSYMRGNKSVIYDHFTREVFESDIFKNKENPSGLPSNISVLNLAYYPKERGPYNYDADGVNPDGTLTRPEKRWGGIQREVQTNDFEAANVEYIEFWMMDPFIGDSAKKNKGGNLYFDLGNVSEDVLKDSRKSFENGLPTGNTIANVDSSSVWGRIPTSQSLVNAFDNDPAARAYQDVGLDGLNNTDEAVKFKSYLDQLAKNVGINSKAYQDALKDPSSDDFRYYRDAEYDQQQLGILDRYKKYNGLEGNSPAQTSTSSDFAASGSSLPNTEDINRDNTLNENESFFQYKVEIKPEKMKIGSNFIVDSVVYVVKNLPSGNKNETWFQFRIPISEYQKTVGSIQDFKSIRFMRMFLNGFSDSVIMRFARLDLVRGEWRKYNLSFRQGGETLSSPEENDGSFEISAVNIENNGTKKPVNYVLPPGITRQIDPQNPQLLQLNEQSMVLKVQDLVNGDAKAAYKNINLDIRQYKRLKMEVHAEQIPGKYLDQKELTVFIRMGSDYKNNYYEYEVPLHLTPITGRKLDNNNDADRLEVWPDENRIDISMDELQQVKQARNDEMRQLGSNVTNSTIFPYAISGRRYYVCGNPNLSNVRTIMIGVRYPYDSNKIGQTRSVEVWVDELRLTDFNEKGGWAANLRTNIRLADLGMINASGSYSTPGFGSIEKKVSQRSKDEIIQYDVSTNLELGKFFPKKMGVQIPMYLGISEALLNPQYNPLDPDIELKAALNNAKSAAERAKIKREAEDRTTRKSMNFTNVKINKQSGKPHFYDVSNWSLNYAYSETNSHNISTQYSIQKRYYGGVMYNFQNRPKNITPFQTVKLFNSPVFRLIKDFNFNLAPTSISFRTDMNRNYSEIALRNLNDPTLEIKVIPSVNKDFTWNRYFNVSYDLTRALKVDFISSNLARIDEPFTTNNVVSRSFKDEYELWKEGVWRNIQSGGRTTHYQHDINITYTIPINKLPMLDWTSASARYGATYDWDAAPLVSADSLNLGNTINNTATLQLNGQLNMITLYNKVPYFRKLLQPKNNSKQPQQKKYKTVTYERDKAMLTANEPRIIFHKLTTEDVKVKVTDANGQEIVGKMKVIDANKISFTADKDYLGTKIVVEGKVEVKPNPLIIIVEDVTRAILGIKNISVSWSQTDGTTLPGFVPKTHMLGLSSADNFYAPGLPFILGFQDKNFPETAIKNQWLSQSPYLNSPYLMSHNDNLNIRSTLEPIPGVKIELNATRSYTKSQRSNYTYDASTGTYPETTRNMQESGNFSMTFISIGSAFDKLSSSNGFASPTFKKFQEYRSIIADRLGTQRENNSKANPGNQPYFKNQDDQGNPLPSGEVNGFSNSSQEVLIPAFMAAYGGINPSKVTLNKFPSIFKMMPNWRISYDGLSKIEFFKKFTRTVSLNHAYRATYNVGNYLTNPDYDTNADIQGILSTIRDLQNNWVPKIDISSVSITEQFGPLISMDMNFKNSLSSKLEIRRNRNIILSLANNQLTETNSNELVVGAGYKFNNVQFIIKSAGGEKKFKSDLNLRADLSIRDNKTIIRRLTDEPDQPSQGQNIVTIKISADYMLSDRFNLRMFYDRIVNTPLVSTSYPTANTNIGFSVRFTLAQ